MDKTVFWDGNHSILQTTSEVVCLLRYLNLVALVNLAARKNKQSDAAKRGR